MVPPSVPGFLPHGGRWFLPGRSCLSTPRVLFLWETHVSSRVGAGDTIAATVVSKESPLSESHAPQSDQAVCVREGCGWPRVRGLCFLEPAFCPRSAPRSRTCALGARVRAHEQAASSSVRQALLTRLSLREPPVPRERRAAPERSRS